MVVKADGLAAGKGAIVCASLDEADRAVALCLEDGAFGEAGRTVVVEEFMTGEEASFFALSDGASALAFGAAQDHKTVWDGDRGPNTGGMGAYSPAPVFDAALEERVMAEIVRPTIAALAKEGCPYQGVLYVGPDDHAPRGRAWSSSTAASAIRSARPSCRASIRICCPLLEAVAAGRGLPASVAWRREASVCVVAASGGYPGPYDTGMPITGVEEAGRLAGVTVFHAGTARRDGALVTAGGRVLGVQALGEDIAGAIGRAYAAMDRIAIPGHARAPGHRPPGRRSAVTRVIAVDARAPEPGAPRRGGGGPAPRRARGVPDRELLRPRRRRPGGRGGGARLQRQGPAGDQAAPRPRRLDRHGGRPRRRSAGRRRAR